MSKLKSAVLYEYLTKVRAIGIFYLIQYLIVALIFTIVAICTKGNETGSNTLEFSSVVFVSVIGVLGYKEDFKALLQNGYTRKYIFGATVCMFTSLINPTALIVNSIALLTISSENTNWNNAITRRMIPDIPTPIKREIVFPTLLMTKIAK